MEQFAEAKPRGVLVAELNGMIEDFLLSQEERTREATPRPGEDEPGQVADNGQCAIPTSENHTRGKLIQEDLIQQITSKLSNYVRFDKHGTKSNQKTLHVLPLGCTFGAKHARTSKRVGRQ